MFDFNIGLSNFTNATISPAFICIMGIGTVFVGLICLIFICKILGVCFKGKKEPQKVASAPVASSAPIANKQEIVAAVSAAVAEELGTEVKNIRITSFKKL